MEKAKIFFECIRCGQPFDIEISQKDFKCKISDASNASKSCDSTETERKCIFEYITKSYCCGNEIELIISVSCDSAGNFKDYDVSAKSLRNFRTDGNFKNLISHLFPS